VGTFDTGQVNAFATGMFRNSGLTAALKRLARGSGQHDLRGEFAVIGISGQRVSGLRRLLLPHPPLE